MNDDNNTDELFRRAAEHYPLRTDSPDWEAVLNKLNAGGIEAGEEQVTKKRDKKYRLLWLLLLLIPIAIFEIRKSSTDKSLAATQQEKSAAAIASNQNNLPAQPVTADKTVRATDKQPQATTAAINGSNVANGTTDSKTPQGNNTISAEKISSPTIVPNATNASTENNESLASGRKYRVKQKSKSAFKVTNAAATEDEVVVVQYPDKKKNTGKENQTTADVEGTDLVKQRAAAIIKEQTTADANNDVAKTQQHSTPSVAVPAEVKKDEAVTEESKKIAAEKEIVKTTEKTNNKENKKNKTGQKHFYAGVIAGPDFSTIKMQSVKKTGLGFGLLVGYRLTNKLSVEAGIIKDKKYYSTDGKYFNTKSMNLPPYYSIEYASGNCNMWELPISLNYTFSKKEKSSWFAAVGVSSYFMRHESYVYDVNYNGYRYPKSYDYANHSSSLFAAINISGGYTHKLGKIGDLRIEPYIKLPINKLGTGKLPIQSGGIYLGLVRNIF